MNFDENKTMEEMLDEMDAMLKEQGEYFAKQPESEERNKAIEANAKLQETHREKHKIVMQLKSRITMDYLMTKTVYEIQKTIQD